VSNLREASARVESEEEPDLVIVADDGTRVTVEVMVHGTPRVVYEAPKRGLGVRFTARGVEPVKVDRAADEVNVGSSESPRARVSVGALKEKIGRKTARK
jgi:hypothetical protein